MTERIKNIAKLITNLISAVFFATICVLNFQEGIDYLNQNINSIGILNYPLAPALFIISLGLAMITLRLLLDCIFIVFPNMKPTVEEANKAIEAEDKIEVHV